jgi:hypothetical protein
MRIVDEWRRVWWGEEIAWVQNALWIERALKCSYDRDPRPAQLFGEAGGL